MVQRNATSRRNCLRSIARAGALAGALTVGASSAGAHDEEGHDHGDGSGTDGDEDAGPDSGEIGLVPECVDAAADEATFRVENGNGWPVEVAWQADHGGADRPIEFPDCRTVRFTGDYAECMIGVVYWDEDGLLATVFVESGPVDGELTVDVSEEFGDVAAGPIVDYAEAFEEGTAVSPGNGDVSRRHPDYDACEEAALAELEGGDGTGGEDGDGTGSEDGTADDVAWSSTGVDGERTELTVPANGSRAFTVDAEDGETTVRLFHGGEEIAVADSATDRLCDENDDHDENDDSDEDGNSDGNDEDGNSDGNDENDDHDNSDGNDDHDDHDGIDPDLLDLEALCYRVGEGTGPEAKFRADNRGDRDVEVTWREAGGDRSGTLSVPANGSADLWLPLGTDCATTVRLFCDGERVAAAAADTTTLCERRDC